MSKLKNPFSEQGSWYKANLHTHTTVSDGKATAAERIEQYAKAGYHVLALTDHRATHDVSALPKSKMLVVSGMEFHPPCRKERTLHHLVALGIPHNLKMSRPGSANACIEDVHRVGGVVILAHPFWTGIDWGTIHTLRGLDAVEVYNTTCKRIGRAESENEWAYMLDHGMAIPAVASDDAHWASSLDVFGCATWLKMPALNVANVLQAVRSGCCYSTTGPKIHDFRVEDGEIRLRCTPAKSIHFMSGPTKGAARWADEGKSITAFTIPCRKWPYVRAVVTDAQGRKAWSNPIWL